MKEIFLENEKNCTVKSLFGCPVMIFKNAVSLKDEELHFIKNIEYQKFYKPNDSEYQEKLVQVSKSQNILNDYIELKNVRKQINHYAGKFIDELISVDNEFDIVQSWISKTLPGINHHSHHHKGALFSLVYYAQADNSTLTFDTKENFLTKGFNFDYNIKEQNYFNSLEVTFKPKTGDIIIFPGYIEHCAENLDNKEKYILGANYFIRGNVGVYNNTTLVTNL
jgi:hypothetical protein